jgi:hypothetical protein
MAGQLQASGAIEVRVPVLNTGTQACRAGKNSSEGQKVIPAQNLRTGPCAAWTACLARAGTEWSFNSILAMQGVLPKGLTTEINAEMNSHEC